MYHIAHHDYFLTLSLQFLIVVKIKLQVFHRRKWLLWTFIVRIPSAYDTVSPKIAIVDTAYSTPQAPVTHGLV